jgi:hypothetical protein
MSLKEIVLEGVDWIHLAQDMDHGACEHGNDPSDSIKCSVIFEQLSNYKLLKKDSAPWG